MDKIVLLGGGGHCKVIIDIIRSVGLYQIVGILDKDKVGENILDVPVIGDDNMLRKLYLDGIKNAFICIGALKNIGIRNDIFIKLKNIGFKIPVLKHNTAVISPFALIKQGTCVMPNVIINAGATIGENCIINSGAIIEHDCIIEKNTHISPNVTIGGGTIIESDCHIGIGSTVLQGITIGKNVTIGAGAVVINNMEDNAVAVGIPAKVLKKKK